MDPLTLSNQTAVPVPVRQGILRSFKLDLSDSKTTARLVLLLLPFPFLLHYLFGLLLFHWAHLRPKQKQLPPTLPHLIPLLGSAVPFAFDCANFIRKATQYAGTLVPVRLSILTGDIFLFQGPKAVAAVWKEQQLGSPIWIYTYALEHVFGMPTRALAAYRADDSGSHRRPHPASRVAPHNRVDFLTHQILFKAFGGSGLTKSFSRCAAILRRNLANLPLPDGNNNNNNNNNNSDDDDGWLEMPDLWAFFQSQLGTAVLEGLYGPSLPRLNPTFLADLWAFDRATPKLAKLLPRFLIRAEHRVRDRLLASIRRWHDYARQHFHESAIAPDGDADPFWGSQLVRSRQEVLRQIDGHDDPDALAAADLGLIWASVTNVVPSAMMTALHIFRCPGLAARVRASLLANEAVDPDRLDVVDMERVLYHQPLLSSCYAETLRLHLQAYVTRASAHRAVELAGWVLPRGKVCMVNTYASHMDEGFWNTKGGEHPVDRFWAERFIIDPADEESGPVRRDVSSEVYRRPTMPRGEEMGGDGAQNQKGHEEKGEKQEPFFSVQGLEGAWIPYGGGYAACPGRHFAKRIILYTTALLVAAFEVEILTERLEMDDACFGLGTQKPKHAVRFRIRRRRGEVKA
ncbi:cytochrome P450 [Achaetomium macrosporum]|uniref:Cytochrome P450 n=1 Tax=Achaetomium macrosporum TaxID=79813 RepID=A0AAN7HAG7_9PEZI|nr:cytochrome P450 [Achaetomium macrosporum]